MELDPWTPGVRLLTRQGISDRHARSFIGRLVKQHGRTRVLRIVEEALSNPPACAQEWLVKRLNSPDDAVKKFSDEWLDREVKAGRVQARPGESYADLRKRLRAA